MSKTHRHRPDAVLFQLWKNGDKEAELELVNKYTAYSCVLAEQLLEEFKNVTRSEKEELIQIGLFSLFVALHKFKGGDHFYLYWKPIAKNNMMDDIKDNSYTYSESKRKEAMHTGIYIMKYRDDVRYYQFDSSSVSNDDDFLRNRLIDLLDNEELRISPTNKRLFLLHLDGYNNTELALLFHVSSSTVKRRINRIKEKLKNILLIS